MKIQEIFGYILGTSSKLVKRKMDNYLNKYNITTSQWAVLKLLYVENKFSQTQIANELLADRATVGDVILKLCEKNYVEKSLNKNDKREYAVSLTTKAKDIIGDIEKMADDVTSQALKGLSTNDKQILYKALNQIISNLSKGE